MYTKRVQIINYGPIDQLDIEFPVDGETLKPVILVGGNGSGKTILLAHIVNGLISAKDRAYPETPEVEPGRVFKLRSSLYIKAGQTASFARVDLHDDLFWSETRLSGTKQPGSEAPSEFELPDAINGWEQVSLNQNEGMESSVLQQNQETLQGIFTGNCVLYFPANRFEEPAWLNEDNLRAQAEHTGLTRMRGHTDRKIINQSPLREIQDWLFSLAYDQFVRERIEKDVFALNPGGPPSLTRAIVGHSGEASNLLGTAVGVTRIILGYIKPVKFGIGERRNRVVSLESDEGTLVPNIFQLSSGETSLLNMFLSILRDFDLSRSQFSVATEITGTVIIDEVDLHLHSIQQHDVLPNLIRMFPKVQFIVTTHSPLFVLGMAQEFGEDGFALFRMPQGQQISPEEFTEFGDAYQAFAATSKFSDDIREAVRNAQTPLLYLEGTTDKQYLQKAAELLGRLGPIQGLEIKDGGGIPGLKTIWGAISKLSEDLVPRKTFLLFDCDYEGPNLANGNRIRLTIPKKIDHPIDTGIENLFNKVALQKAMDCKPDFIDITEAHNEKIRGKIQLVPEQWAVNEDEKTNLCNWLCENGTDEDFHHFQVVFDLLEESLGCAKNDLCSSA